MPVFEFGEDGEANLKRGRLSDSTGRAPTAAGLGGGETIGVLVVVLGAGQSDLWVRTAVDLRVPGKLRIGA